MVTTTDTRSFVDGLIAMPANQRKKHLNDYFVELSVSEGSFRTRVMEGLMKTTGALPQDARREYLRLRTEVLTELEMNTQMAILSTYREILLTMAADQAELEVNELKAIRQDLDPKYHQMVERFVHFLPRKENGHAPALAGATTVDTGRKWWRFWAKS